MGHKRAILMSVRNVPGHQTTLRDKRALVVEDEALVAMMVEDELIDADAKVIGPASTTVALPNLGTYLALLIYQELLHARFAGEN